MSRDRSGDVLSADLISNLNKKGFLQRVRFPNRKSAWYIKKTLRRNKYHQLLRVNEYQYGGMTMGDTAGDSNQTYGQPVGELSVGQNLTNLVLVIHFL